MNKGFTLIELLAVIIILTLLMGMGIFLVNGILTNSRKELSDTQKRNLEKIAETYNISEGIDNDAYCVSVSTLLKKGYIEGTSVIDPKNKEQLTGSIRIKYINNKYTYTYQDKECSPCELVSGEENEIGSKYECEVKKGTMYNFYVLSYNDENNNTIYDKSKSVTTNLIMDSNINASGEAIKSNNIEDKGLVAWINQEDYESVSDNNWEDWKDNNNYGPISAINYLNAITSTWSNLENLNITYNDEGGHFTIPITGKARLPYLSEVHMTGKCSYAVGSCPLYLVNYLKSSSHVSGEGLQNISGIWGYWILSSLADDPYCVWRVFYDGYVYHRSVADIDAYYGVRPVITVKL